MRQQFKLRVRFSPYRSLKLTNSNLLQAFAKFSVLLPVALLLLPGIAKTGECMAAPARHHQRAREKGVARNYAPANAPGPARKGLHHNLATAVHVGTFEPVSLAKPSREMSSRVVQTEVFGARNIISNKAPAPGPEKAARLGLFDRGSDAWAENSKEAVPAEDVSSARSVLWNGNGTSVGSVQ